MFKSTCNIGYYIVTGIYKVALIWSVSIKEINEILFALYKNSDGNRAYITKLK